MASRLVGVAEIAELLGVSRQRVAQLVASGVDFPRAEAELSAGRVWWRDDVQRWIDEHRSGRQEGSWRVEGKELLGQFTLRARRVVVLSREEARALGHNHVGTEHLLLGLLREVDGLASRAMQACGLDVAKVREEIVATAGRGASAPGGVVPF